MSGFDTVLIVTHIIYDKTSPEDAREGPYSSICRALALTFKNVETCQMPLFGFNGPVIYGRWGKSRKLKIPPLLGKISVLKYLTDISITSLLATVFNLANRNRKKLLIGIDPLSCLPLVFLKKIFNYQLVFYSVDFNKRRFGNKILQKLYEKADEISSRFSDQTWVVSEALKNYKKDNYQIESFYIPNSPIYNERSYKEGKVKRAGNKMVWIGSFPTARQREVLFETLKEIQDKVRPDLKFYFIAYGDLQEFEGFCQRYQLKKYQIFGPRSRPECQKLVAQCDIGIALYDDQFGSTEFIEPLKIWDFMMCGAPFIISSEPSISNPIKKAEVVYFLNPGNKIPPDDSLREFLKPENLNRLQEKCIELAKEFDIQKQVEKTLKKI